MNTTPTKTSAIPSLRLITCLAFTCLLSATAVCRADTEIVAGGTTYGLPDIATLKSSEAVRSTLRVLQLASAAVASDATDASAAVAVAKTNIEEHNERQAALAGEIDRHNETARAYLQRLAEYNERLGVYSSQVAVHDAQAEASNSLPPEQRNAGTVARLNAEKRAFDRVKSGLDSDKAGLDQAQSAINQESADLNDRNQAIGAEADRLNAEMKSALVRLGEAYRQLLICNTYSIRAKVLCKRYQLPADADFDAAVSGISGAIEQIKSDAGAGFDGNNPDLQPLSPADVRPPLGITTN